MPSSDMVHAQTHSMEEHSRSKGTTGATDTASRCSTRDHTDHSTKAAQVPTKGGESDQHKHSPALTTRKLY
eukprot:m.141140 g.141140  ORF g.141140 m.141140 type:complete len:71 (+) comp13191_c5_seq1:2148-2360(+)